MPDEIEEGAQSPETTDAQTNEGAGDPEGSPEKGVGEVETQGEPESEGETDATGAESPADGAKGEPEEEGDAPRYSFPKEVGDALKDRPEALKAAQDRWRMACRGLEKQEAKAEAVKASIGDLSPEEAQAALQHFSMLVNPDTGPGQVKELLQRMSKAWKLPIEQLAGIETERKFHDEYGNEIEEWEHEGFDSKGQYRIWLEQKRANDIKAGVVSAGQKTDKGAAQQPKADAGFEQTLLKIKTEKAGFPLTREMYQEAVRELPQFRDDPAKAVKKWFGEEIEAHMLKVAAKSRKAGHTMPADRSQGKGASRESKPGDFAATMRRLESQGKL